MPKPFSRRTKFSSDWKKTVRRFPVAGTALDSADLRRQLPHMKKLIVSLLVFAVWSVVAADDKPFVVWNNPPAKPQEFLTHHTYRSAVMNTEVGYNLYLPPDYNAAGNTNRYPVIYWCHGMNCHESIDQFPARLVEEAIRKKVIPPLIFVYVSGGSQTFYCDSPGLKFASETTITKELIPHIDATYRTLATRDFRAIQGMSMGGFGSMRLALRHPELFSSVVAFAGGYVGPERLAQPERRQHLDIMFGGDTNNFIAAHPATIAQQNADALRGKLGIKMLVGEFDFHLTNNRAMHQALVDAKLDHEFSEVPDTKHDLKRLSQWIGSDGLEFAVKHFASARDTSNDGPWVNPPKPNEKATGTEHHIYWSELLRRPVGYNIYLPPTYYDGPGRGLAINTTRYPVVYYLHGMTDSESSHLYNVARLDDAIRAGRVPPMICVWTYEGRRSWFTDYADGSVLAESMFIKELIPQIDARWRTLADRGHRSLHGFSMGGNGTLRLAAKHAELFSSAVCVAGAYVNYESFHQRRADVSAQMFGSKERYDADSPWTLVREKTDALKNLPLRLDVGDKDFLLEPNRKMHALLTELGVQHAYTEIPGVGHDPKRVWDAQGEALYAFSAKHFAKP